MSDTLEALGKLSAAEEFFELLSIPYDPAVVQVNRLHILKRFNQYLRTTRPDAAELDSDAQFQACRDLLLRAYGDFIRSTPAQEKVFKVFQDAEGGHVALDSLRSSLPPRNGPRT
ncbi:MAG: nitrogenase stabilizing/protective protein NifW [Gammaproteobacteria bacterium]